MTDQPSPIQSIDPDKVHPLDFASYALTFSWENYNAKIAEQLGWALKPKKVLDVGCALGYSVKAFRFYGVDAYGCDINERALRLAEPEALPYLKLCDLRKGLPYSDGEFDLVLCNSVLHQGFSKAEIEFAFLEMARVSSEHVVVSMPVSIGERRFNVASFLAAASKSGLPLIAPSPKVTDGSPDRLWFHFKKSAAKKKDKESPKETGTQHKKGETDFHGDSPRYWKASEEIRSRNPKSVLHLSCGRGFVLKRLEDAGIRVKGLETSARHWHTRVVENVVCHDVTETPWPVSDREFDLCFSDGVLERIPKEKLAAVISEIERTCVAGLHVVERVDSWKGVLPKTHEAVSKGTLASPIYPKWDGLVKLNIGCGKTMFGVGWRNIDDDPELQAVAEADGYVYNCYDFRKNLPYDDGVVDLILLPNTLERLSYEEGAQLLKECRRVLNPNGLLRLSVTDARMLMDKYRDGKLSEYDGFSEACCKSEAQVGKLTHLLLSGKKTLYDATTVESLLRSAEFQRITLSSFRKSGSLDMLTDTVDQFPTLCLYVEAARENASEPREALTPSTKEVGAEPELDRIRQMLWNDQGLAAKSAVEKLLRDRPNDVSLMKLSSEIEEWLKHTSSKEAYKEFYTSHRLAVTTAEGVLSAHDRIPRLGLIRKWMSACPPKSIIEFGCLDGFALLNLAIAYGAKGTGVDLDETALVHARKLAAELNADCTFVSGFAEDVCFPERADAVLILELLEHVLDPSSLIRAAERCLAERGRIYISTPATPVPHLGNVHEAREHIRCMTAGELRTALGDLVIEKSMLQRPSEHIERIACVRRPRIAFLLNEVSGGWSPLEPKTYAGSEEAVVALSAVLSELSYEVEVYYNAPSGVEPTIRVGGGAREVVYRPRDKFVPTADWDIVVCVKCPDALDLPFRPKQVIFWTADPHGPDELTPERMTKVSKVVAISDWHRDELLKNNPQLRPDLIVSIPLGVQDGILSASPPVDRRPHRMVYASSFDRGLEGLLKAWAQIRSRVPDAELHVWYGWDLFDKFMDGNHQALAWKEHMQALMRQDGISVHPRAERPDDPTPFVEAAVWAYPCTGGERFCLTGVKAQKLGAVPVIVPTMALSETVKYGRKLSQREFVNGLVDALLDEKWQKSERQRMMNDPDVALSWSRVAAEWRKLWLSKLGDL